MDYTEREQKFLNISIHYMNSSVYFYFSIFSGIASVLSAMTYYSLSGIDLIPASQAKKLIKSGDLKQIVDIRTKMEYDAGHYPNSTHLPVNKISEKTVKKLDKNAATLVYCNTGQRARYAAEKMKKLGFKEIYYIDGTYSTIM